MSAYIKFLHQQGNQSITDIYRKYGRDNNVSRATVGRHASSQINILNGVIRKKSNAGRKKLLSQRDIRNVLRVFQQARSQNPNFTSKKIQLEAGLNGLCSNRTVRRALNANALYYLQPRKKGLLSKKDLKDRVAFARNVKKRNLNNIEHWTNGIAFYFDGTGFVHKTHPADQATAPKGRIWRKIGEGLHQGCTAKGSKAGYNGRVAHFFVSISYGKGVISCIQYLDTLTGAMFSQFMKDNFKDIFAKCGNSGSCTFLQDGDPRQNSKLAKDTMRSLGIECYGIPARSPDLNPIENVFHLVDIALAEEAVKKNIISETFEEFSTRVRNCMLTFSTDTIDRILESMPKRIDLIIKCKGRRLKY